MFGRPKCPTYLPHSPLESIKELVDVTSQKDGIPLFICVLGVFDEIDGDLEFLCILICVDDLYEYRCRHHCHIPFTKYHSPFVDHLPSLFLRMIWEKYVQLRVQCSPFPVYE